MLVENMAKKGEPAEEYNEFGCEDAPGSALSTPGSDKESDGKV